MTDFWAIICPKCKGFEDIVGIFEAVGYVSVNGFQDNEIEFVGDFDIEESRPQQDEEGNDVFLCLNCQYKGNIKSFGRSQDV